MKFGNKGISLSEMSNVAMLFVVVGVTIGIGAYTLSQIAITGGFSAGTVQNSTIANATEGLAKLSSWLPIIAVVIAAGLVIGVLVTAFSGRGGV